MKRLFIFLLFISAIAQAQPITATFGSPNSGTGIKGSLYIDSMAYLPPVVFRTPSRPGALRYNPDSTLSLWTGFQWQVVSSPAISINHWNEAYNKYVVSAAVTGTSSKTMTFTRHDGTTFTATWTESGTVTETDPIFSASQAFGITATDKTHWNQAYNKYVNSAAITGTGTKTITFTRNDGTTFVASFTDQGITAETDPVFASSAAAGITNTMRTNWTEAYDKYTSSAAVTGTTTKTMTFTRRDGTTYTATWSDIGGAIPTAIDFTGTNTKTATITMSDASTISNTFTDISLQSQNITLPGNRSIFQGTNNLTMTNGQVDIFTNGTGADNNNSQVLFEPEFSLVKQLNLNGSAWFQAGINTGIYPFAQMHAQDVSNAVKISDVMVYKDSLVLVGRNQDIRIRYTGTSVDTATYKPVGMDPVLGKLKMMPNWTWAPSSGSSSYIQNGTSAQTANYNITGSGTAASHIATSDQAFQYSPSSTYGFEITQRDALKVSNLPVPSIRPTTTNTNIALDIMPNGTVSNWGTQPITWMDVVDADMKTGQPAANAARVGINSTAGVFGTWSFNGASGKPVEIYANGTKVVDIGMDALNSVTFSSRRTTMTGAPVGDYVGLALFNSNNTDQNSDALFFVGNALSGGKFGFIRWTNNAMPAGTQVYRNPNQLEILANTGNTNGLVLGTLQNSPIKFIQGANANGQEVARFYDNGHFGIGLSIPSAWIHVKSSTGAANTAPIKLSPGTLLTSPEDGAFEYDGIHPYFTIGSTRVAMDGGGGGGGGGETNTASNVGGGLANFDSKVGVDLQFNTFTAADFNLASNLISIDYTNGQAASASTKGFLTAADWSAFNSKQGAISFTAADFDGTTTISLDYTNGQKASASVPGFLSSTDWSTFNSKQAALTFTAADFDVASNTVTLDYVNGQKATASVPGFLSSTDWSTFNGKQSPATTLGGYGITDALSNSTTSTQDGYFSTVRLKDVTSPSHYLTLDVNEDLTATHALHIVTGNTDRTLTFAGNATISGTNSGDQTLASLGALGQPAANGIVARTAANTSTNRTLTGTTNRIAITNGDGVSGNPTFDIGSDVVTLTGAQSISNKFVSLSAGTTLGAPLVMNSGPVLGTPAAGAIEYDGSTPYFTNASILRNYITAKAHVGIASGTVALTSGTGAQAAFASANDVIPLAASTTYRFTGIYYISNGTVSHATQTGFAYSGTLTSILYSVSAAGTAANSAATSSISIINAVTLTTVTAANTQAGAVVQLEGTLRTNTAGNLTPQIGFTVAPTGTNTMNANSFFEIWPVGTSTVTSVGAWQ